MHRLIIALACWLVLPALAGQPAILQASSNNSGVWQRLYVGAGGYLIGMSIANDNTMVVNTDTYGAYLWDPSGSSGASGASTGVWQQLVTAASMPPAYVAYAQGQNGGVWDIQVTAANSNVMYMINNVAVPGHYYPVYQGVYRSANRGQTWTLTAPLNGSSYFVVGQTYENTDPTPKLFGPKLAIDPNNSNNVYVGTLNNGIFYTTNGGEFLERCERRA